MAQANMDYSGLNKGVDSQVGAAIRQRGVTEDAAISQGANATVGKQLVDEAMMMWKEDRLEGKLIAKEERAGVLEQTKYDRNKADDEAALAEQRAYDKPLRDAKIKEAESMASFRQSQAKASYDKLPERDKIAVNGINKQQTALINDAPDETYSADMVKRWNETYKDLQKQKIMTLYRGDSNKETRLQMLESLEEKTNAINNEASKIPTIKDGADKSSTKKVGDVKDSRFEGSVYNTSIRPMLTDMFEYFGTIRDERQEKVDKQFGE